MWISGSSINLLRHNRIHLQLTETWGIDDYGNTCIVALDEFLSSLSQVFDKAPQDHSSLLDWGTWVLQWKKDVVKKKKKRTHTHSCTILIVKTNLEYLSFCGTFLLTVTLPQIEFIELLLLGRTELNRVSHHDWSHYGHRLLDNAQLWVNCLIIDVS